MEKYFKEILEIEDVRGILVLDHRGGLRLKALRDQAVKPAADHDWSGLVQSLGGVPVAELVFEHQRVYFHQAGDGYVAVIMGRSAPMAMVRRNCEAIAAGLSRSASRSGTR